MKRHNEWALERYREVRAVVRCTCGYTPEVLRAMSWEELRQAYKDSQYYIQITTNRAI